MKKAAIVLVAISMSLHAAAQKTSGKVTYKETVDLRTAFEDVKLEGDAAEAMAGIADMLPKEQSVTKQLFFTPDASLYKNAKSQPDEKEYKEGSAVMHINMSMPQEVTYRNLKEKKMVEQKEFMGRKFLISSDVEKTDWKMTGQQKSLLGYPCQQATKKNDKGETVTAWFTPAIPVSTGPLNAGGLPGLILAMEVGKGYSVEATSLNFDPVDAKIVAKPTEGKKMTKKEFDAVVAEKTKEMNADGGDGNVIIKVQRR